MSLPSYAFRIGRTSAGLKIPMAAVSGNAIFRRTFQEWDEVNEAFVASGALPRLDDDCVFRLQSRVLCVDVEENDFGEIPIEV